LSGAKQAYSAYEVDALAAAGGVCANLRHQHKHQYRNMAALVNPCLRECFQYIVAVKRKEEGREQRYRNDMAMAETSINNMA